VRRWQRKRPRSRRRQGLRGWLSVELLCVCSVDFRHDSRSDVRRAVNKQTTQLPRKNQPILPRKRKRKAENRKPGRKFSKYHDNFFFSYFVYVPSSVVCFVLNIFFVLTVVCLLFFVCPQWRVTLGVPNVNPQKNRRTYEYYLVLGQTGCARVPLRTCSPTTSATDNIII